MADHADHMDAEQKKREAEWDAQTIASAAVITADPQRLKAAKSAAKELHRDKDAEADGLKKLVDGFYDHKDSKEKGKADDDSRK